MCIFNIGGGPFFSVSPVDGRDEAVLADLTRARSAATIRLGGGRTKPREDEGGVETFPASNDDGANPEADP